MRALITDINYKFGGPIEIKAISNHYDVFDDLCMAAQMGVEVDILTQTRIEAYKAAYEHAKADNNTEICTALMAACLGKRE